MTMAPSPRAAWRRKWEPSPPALVRVFERALGKLRGVERRTMFGYPAVFVNGYMFAGLVRDRLILRLGDADRERLLGRPGARPFVAMGRTMKQWVVVPPAMSTSGRGLGVWLGRALVHGRSLPAKGRLRRRGHPRPSDRG